MNLFKSKQYEESPAYGELRKLSDDDKWLELIKNVKDYHSLTLVSRNTNTVEIEDELYIKLKSMYSDEDSIRVVSLLYKSMAREIKFKVNIMYIVCTLLVIGIVIMLVYQISNKINGLG